GAAAADLYLEMAGILQRAERAQDLADLMGEATTVLPERAALWLLRLRALAAGGRWDEAAAVARDADRRFGAAAGSALGRDDRPGAPDGLPAGSFVVELADLHARQNRVDQAIALLLPLSTAGELGFEPSLWLGRMLLGTGRRAEGAALADRILAAWPQAARARHLKGRVAELAEDWDEALRWYRKAIESDPDDGEIRLACIRALLVARGKPPTAAATALAERKREMGDHCTAAAALVPERDTGGQMILGYGFRAAGDLMRAAERFALAATDEDLRLGALIQKSLCHDELGEDDAAREDLELLRREFPDNAEVANSLGYYLAEKGVDLERAETMIRQALAADPGNGAYLDSLGWVLYRQGRFESALDHLIQAVNVLPEDPVILEHLGVVLNVSGRSREALDMFRRALTFGGDAGRLNASIAEIERPGAARR
ncbi:tetratricopeptide repeat protein, partial [bacterium]|nr:tetratricopeptide repeat protein [bacterium]